MPLTKSLRPNINQFLTKHLGGVEVGIGKLTLPDTFSISFGAIGAAAKQFSSSIWGSPKPASSYSVVESEIVMKGEIVSKPGLEGHEITLLTPGSLGTNVSSIPWTTYPAYNEALGTFALLETPKIKYNLDIEIRPNSFKTSYQLDGNSIKYFF